jgi:nucleoside-diphosphate-sugar epimerase
MKVIKDKSGSVKRFVMDAQERRCAVTGTGGYLGSRLSRALRKGDWTVYELSRQWSERSDFSVPFSFAQGAPRNFFKEKRINALVHCAYDFRLTDWADILEHNVKGSIRLMETARVEGVEKITFISTMSAFEGCKSLYGKAKLEIEKEALRLGAIVVRPGLIYGDEPGGMVRALIKAIKASPIVPLVGSGKQVLHLVHEDDLAALVRRLLSEDEADIHAPIIGAAEKGRTFKEILTALAAVNERKIRLVPIPWRLFWGLLKLSEAIGLKPGFQSDSVISLVNQDPHPEFGETRKMGVLFRDFDIAP